VIEAAAFAVFDARLDPTSRAPLAVAVSGGGDSVALLWLAAAWAGRHHRPLQVLTVDHGLNAASAAWTAFVAGAAVRLGLATRVLRWSGPKPATGLPAAAREARHRLLGQAAREAGARVLLMGHTADDRLEGERMRAEGASVGDPREWTPSPAWPEGRDVFLLRPLLAIRREPLRDWLRAQGEAWIEDPANQDVRFHRARVRDPSPFVGEGVFRSGTDDGEFPLDAAGASETPHPAASQPPSPARGEGLLALARAEATKWLGPATLCAAGGARPPRAERLRALSDRLATGENFTATLAGARLTARGDCVLLGRDAGRSGIPPLAVEAGEAVWDGRFAVVTDRPGAVVALRGRLARLEPAARAALAGVPSWQRPTLPILETPDGKLRMVRRRCLVHDRWLAACGAFAREAELPPLTVAQPLQRTYL